MSSPVQYSPPSHCGFSPRVIRRLEARLQRIAKERKDNGEWDSDPSDEACEGHGGCDFKRSGHGGQMGDNNDHDHISNHGSGYSAGDNDSLLVQASSDESPTHKTPLNDSLLGSPVLSLPKEDPGGMPSVTALRGLSLVKGNHPGYFVEDAYIRPAASNLEIVEDYWVKYDYPAIRALLRVPTEELPDSHRSFAPIPGTPAYEPRRKFSEKMEESGYLVRGRRIYSSNSPNRYRFVPISRFGDTEDRSAKLSVDVKDDVKSGDYVKVKSKSHSFVKVGNNSKVEGNFTSTSAIDMDKDPASHSIDDGTDEDDNNSEWEFVSTWPEAKEAKALLELPTSRGFPHTPLL